MDRLLNSELPWQLKTLILLVPALALALPLLLIPKKRLARFGGKRWGSPNWITLASILIFWPGVDVFFHHSVFWGAQALVVASILDILDGRKSVGMEEEGIVRSALDRWFGAWFDPLADKFRVLPLLTIFMHLGAVSPWIVYPTIAIELTGTLLREPFSTFLAAYRDPAPVDFRNRLKAEIERSAGVKSRANTIGKVKAAIQHFGFIPCALYWLDFQRAWHLPDWFFGLALPLCLLSVFSRYLKIPALQNFLARTRKYFSHQEVF